LLVIIKIFKAILGVLSSNKFSKDRYLKTLKMLNDLFKKGRKSGLTSLESDVEEPESSELFKTYPEVMKDHHVVAFICDTVRTGMSGTVSHFDLDQMIELDLEVHHREVSVPVNALTTVADALPGLGIVAAVLGVVITMGSLGGPPEEIGRKVAAALVGTFLGILLCYGFLSPLAASITKSNDAESEYYHCLRTGLIAFFRGAAPILAVEFSRRSIPAAVRPSFKEMEEAFRGGKEA
jgi:chemotaxis protein MotA